MSINYHGGLLDLLIQEESGAETTIVVFHAAVPTTATLPVFAGIGVTRTLKANLVFVADPTLALNSQLTLGWFAGNRLQPLQKDLPLVLEHILDGLGSKHTIFHGPSGGGFAALYYSAQFPGSLAIPTNPQTIIENFSPYSVRAYVEAAFGAVDNLAGAIESLDRYVVHDLCELYGKGQSNAVAYLQNIPDSRHMERHLGPFYSACRPSPLTRYLLGDWGPGHHAPPKDLIRDVLTTATRAAGDWKGMLDALGFAEEIPGIVAQTP